jgi:hypothetical protein
LFIGLAKDALWPFVVLLFVGSALVYLRREITRLFGRRIRAKYGDFEVWFDPEEKAKHDRADFEARLQLVEQSLIGFEAAETSLDQPLTPDTSSFAGVTVTDSQVAAVDAYVLAECPEPQCKTTIRTIAAMLRFQESVVAACVERSDKVQFDDIEALRRLGFIHPRWKT